VTHRAGIVKQVSPHTLRRAFITAALDAGVPLRDVQEAASHADPRTTMRYDRARTSLDRGVCSSVISGPGQPELDPEPREVTEMVTVATGRDREPLIWVIDASWAFIGFCTQNATLRPPAAGRHEGRALDLRAARGNPWRAVPGR
jgi:hypothetical protein